jgi:hypothetical protein
VCGSAGSAERVKASMPKLPEEDKQIKGRAWSLVMLKVLNDVYRRRGTEIYSGTVPAPVVAKRRARNKRARRARRLNRR